MTPEELQKLLEDYNQLSSSRPSAPQRDGYSTGTTIGALLGGIGDVFKTKGGQSGGNTAAAIFGAEDQKYKELMDQQNAEWERDVGLAKDRLGNALAIGKYGAELEKIKKVGEMSPYELEKHALEMDKLKAQAAAERARANKYNSGGTSSGGEPKPMTEYQREMLDLKKQEAEGKTPPQTQYEKTVETEQAKLDVKKSLEAPQAEQNVTNISMALEPGGLMDRLEKEGEVGGGLFGWRKYMLEDDSKLSSFYHANLSADQQQLDKILTSLATARAKANNPTGQITNADVEMAKREIASIGDNPAVLRRVLTDALTLEKARVERARQLGGGNKDGVTTITPPVVAPSSNKQDKYGF